MAEVVGGNLVCPDGAGRHPDADRAKARGGVAGRSAASDDFKARMKSLSGTSIGGTADELTAQMKAEVQRWSAVVKAANIKFEQ